MTENRQSHDLGDMTSLIWDIRDGVEVVYFEDNETGEEIDVMVETTDYYKAKRVYDATLEYMEA